MGEAVWPVREHDHVHQGLDDTARSSQAPSQPSGVHGYLYFRWATAYVRVARFFLARERLLPRLRSRVGRWLARSHHAKIVPTAQACRILTADKPVELLNTEQVVPFSVARDIVLEAPPRIVLAECACRAAARREDAWCDKGRRQAPLASCGPLHSCLYMGEPIASFVLHHRGDGARPVDVDGALAVVNAAAEHGNIHTIWFKDVAGGRMYALCNCCTCCCTVLAALARGFAAVADSGFCAWVDAERCAGCGDCASACPFSALAWSGGRGARPGRGVQPRVDADRCVGCGLCTRRCNKGALGLESRAQGMVPLPL